jgi:hypothetical protein
MDTKTMLTALLLILVVVAPFYIHHLRLRRKEKILAAPLLQAARQAGARISKQQVFQQAVLAVDAEAALLFFLPFQTGEAALQQISLHGLQRCTVYTGVRNAADEPDRVELRLHTGSKEERLLLFERGTNSAFLNDEIPAAHTWAGFLNSRFAR